MVIKDKVATTVPVRVEMVFAVTFRLRSFSLDLSAFTLDAITNCMEDAAISHLTSSWVPVSLAREFSNMAVKRSTASLIAVSILSISLSTVNATSSSPGLRSSH
ncbi:hypothetical protein E2C01_010551 [Portunus trituberculatus]|uniref:Uncharacterized protein n=1 Tax=Portunus trituberculatus TaxID=210409 RepID=A0A5B7D8P2_PORTR|nr:hypothetical protein [Portunus trituberculatus]